MNAPDLDIVLVGCECGNQLAVPLDALRQIDIQMARCGKCGKSGRMSVLADPSPNKKA